MPACLNCHMFDISRTVCKGTGKSAIRNCITASLEQRFDLINEGDKILEIGCGKIDYIKNLTEKNAAKWYGVDPKANSIATHQGSVAKLPFNNQFFEIVFSSQSIEHWYEYSVTFDKGLSEIHRVLKPNGLLLLDFPIYLHGHTIFMLGKNSSINRLFESKSWTIEDVEDWRKNFSPLEPYFSWDGTRKKYSNEYICEKIIRKKEKSAYIRVMLIRKNNE